jgi:hypothetical protein
MRAQEFSEDNFGTHPRRVARPGSRPGRGHEPVPQYRSVEEKKIKGVDNKTCWPGHRYTGQEKKADGTYKDRCVKVGENNHDKIGNRHDPDDFDAMVSRLGQKAKQQPMSDVSPIVKQMRDELAQINQARNEKSS